MATNIKELVAELSKEAPDVPPNIIRNMVVWRHAQSLAERGQSELIIRKWMEENGIPWKVWQEEFWKMRVRQ